METVEQKIQKSLRYSVLDGSFYAAMVGMGESFFAAFAVFLKATNIQLGILGSLPQMIGSLSMLFSNRLLSLFQSRQKLVCWGAFIQGLIYIPIMFVFLYGTFKIYYLLVLVCLYWIFGMILSPAWNSWMGDLVDEKVRGSYFGRRNRIAGLVSFAAFLLAGYILQVFSHDVSKEYMGFIVIFAMALIARTLSTLFLLKKYEPSYKVAQNSQIGLFQFLHQARSDNFGLLVMYLCSINFGTFIAAPFFTPYMLQDLSFDYKTFMLISAVAILTKFFLMPVWGGLSDRYGTRKVLSVSGFLMPLVPVLWFFSTEVWYLVLAQAYSGFVWAGFELAAFNFIFDTTKPDKRATYIAYYNVLNGISIFAGALTGALIVKYNQLFWSKYYLVFILSFVFRMAASIVFVPGLKEVREVQSISYRELLLRVFTTMPTRGIVFNVITFRKHNRASKSAHDHRE